MQYNKLVRDRIPEIIDMSGSKAIYRILEDAEYKEALEKKLDEEVAEYHKSKSIEELADILEVLHALSYAYGSCPLDLQDKNSEKYIDRGGFNKRIMLIETIEKGGAE